MALVAALYMIIAGSFGFLQGIALIAKGTFYVQPQNTGSTPAHPLGVGGC